MAIDSGLKVKIGLIGPCQSGKTILANFLSDATESLLEDYNPTHVVRVLEFDVNVNVNNRSSKAEVELWDCSGNSKFQNTWPALVWELHGIIFVFNPEDETHGPDLDFYYANFVKKSNIQDSNCLVLAFNNSDEESKPGNVKLCNFTLIS